MRESRTEVLVGAVVVVAAVGFLGYALKGNSFTAGGSKYEVTASFRSAEGVSVGTDVRMSGVSIGSVSGMELNTTNFRAETTLRLNGNVPIPADSTAVVSSDGIMGGAFIEIVPGGAFEDLPAGGEITDTQGAVSLIQLLMQYVMGSGESA